MGAAVQSRADYLTAARGAQEARRAFGRLLRDRRILRGLTLATLAHQVRVSKASVTNWQAGRCLPVDDAVRVRLLEALGLPPNALDTLPDPVFRHPRTWTRTGYRTRRVVLRCGHKEETLLHRSLTSEEVRAHLRDVAREDCRTCEHSSKVFMEREAVHPSIRASMPKGKSRSGPPPSVS